MKPSRGLSAAGYGFRGPPTEHVQNPFLFWKSGTKSMVYMFPGRSCAAISCDLERRMGTCSVLSGRTNAVINAGIRNVALRRRVERRKTGPVRHAERDGGFETEKEWQEKGREKAEESQKTAEATRGGGKQIEKSKAGEVEVEMGSDRAESKEERSRGVRGRDNRDESEFTQARGRKREAAKHKASDTEERMISNGGENKEERPRDDKDHTARPSDEKKEEGREIRRVKYEKSKASSKLQKQARRPVGPPLAPSVRQRKTLKEARFRSPSTSSSHVGDSTHKAKAMEMRSRGASKTGEVTPSLGDKEGIEPTPKGEAAEPVENQSWQLEMVKPMEGQGLILHVKRPASLARQEEPQIFALVTKTKAERAGMKEAEGAITWQTEGVWDSPQKDVEQEGQKTGQGEPPMEVEDRLVFTWKGRASAEYRAVRSAFMPSLQEPFPGIRELMEEVDMEVRENRDSGTETLTPEQVTFSVHQENAAESREKGSACRHSPERKNLSGGRRENASEEKGGESEEVGVGPGAYRRKSNIGSVGVFEDTGKEGTLKNSERLENGDDFSSPETEDESDRASGAVKEVAGILSPADLETLDARAHETKSAEAEGSKMQQEGLVSQLSGADLGKAWQEVVQSEIDGEESLALENGVLDLEPEAGGEGAWSGEESSGTGSSRNEQINPENEGLKEADMKMDLGKGLESSRGNEAGKGEATERETDGPKDAGHSGVSGGGLQDERTEGSKSAHVEERTESKSAHVEERTESESAHVEESTESNPGDFEEEKTAEDREKQGEPSAGGQGLPRNSVASAVQFTEALPQETFHSEHFLPKTATLHSMQILGLTAESESTWHELMESLIGGLHSPPTIWPPEDVPENSVALTRSASRETALVKSVPEPGYLPAVREGLSEGLASKRAEGEGLAVKRTQGEGLAFKRTQEDGLAIERTQGEGIEGLYSQNGPITDMAGGQIAEEEIKDKGTGSDQARKGPVSQLMESSGGTEIVMSGEEKNEKEEKEAPPESLAGRAVIKIVGVGGGGCNAVDHMVQGKKTNLDSHT
jgi:hypothetical protein